MVADLKCIFHHLPNSWFVIKSPTLTKPQYATGNLAIATFRFMLAYCNRSIDLLQMGQYSLTLGVGILFSDRRTRDPILSSDAPNKVLFKQLKALI